MKINAMSAGALKRVLRATADTIATIKWVNGDKLDFVTHHTFGTNMTPKMIRPTHMRAAVWMARHVFRLPDDQPVLIHRID